MESHGSGMERTLGLLGSPFLAPCPKCVYNCKFIHILLSHEVPSVMRTNIDIDDDLMEQAMKATNLKTKKETVEMGLKTLVMLQQQAEIRKFRGKLAWTGNLDELRAR